MQVCLTCQVRHGYLEQNGDYCSVFLWSLKIIKKRTQQQHELPSVHFWSLSPVDRVLAFFSHPSQKKCFPSWTEVLCSSLQLSYHSSFSSPLLFSCVFLSKRWGHIVICCSFFISNQTPHSCLHIWNTQRTLTTDEILGGAWTGTEVLPLKLHFISDKTKTKISFSLTFFVWVFFPSGISQLTMGIFLTDVFFIRLKFYPNNTMVLLMRYFCWVFIFFTMRV